MKPHEVLRAEIVPTSFWVGLMTAAILTYCSRFTEPNQLALIFCVMFTGITLGLATLMALILWPLFFLLDAVFGP